MDSAPQDRDFGETRSLRVLFPGTVISHYRIMERIGAGGMGVVYKAEDTKLKRHVALKFLPPDLTRDPEAKERFVQEAQSASSLDDPNICNIHEIDETDDGQMFIAMACYEGETLRERIERGPLDLDEALDIAIQVARGLSKAHDKGIVHRDIKPGNMMITTDGVVKIMDFGLAKLTGQTGITRAGTVLGTIAYMSPEQTQGVEVDHRTDIWSLGVMLYEMLTGQPPFRGDYEEAVIYSILNEEPEAVGHKRAGVPSNLASIVAQSLCKSAAARYQTALGILADLQHARDRSIEHDGKEMTPTLKHPTSIAVLPFANLSGDPDQEYFCEGIAEEIINTLTHVDGLRVVARTSSFAFKGKSEDIRQIGQKLNVGRLLEGSVRKVGSRVRVTAQLVNVSDGYRLWSETYDRNMDDIFAIQDEVSLAIVGKLKVGLVDGEMAGAARRHSKDFRAYNLYLHGRYFWSKRTEADLEKALQYFKRAIACDPAYALAYSGLADTYAILHDYGVMEPTEAYQKATDAALKALALDDSLAEAHTSLAGIKTDSAWDWDEAESEYKRAIELNPGYATTHHWYAILLELKGDFENALKEGERALELDPLSMILKRYVASLRTSAFDWKGAEDLYRSALELYPADGRTRGFYSLFLLQIGRREEAVSEIRRALEDVPASLSARCCYGEILYHIGEYGKAIAEMEAVVETSPNSYFARTVLGSAYLMSQMYEESLRELRMAQQLSRRGSDSYFHAEAMIGVILALMGRRDGAHEILDGLLRPSAPVYIPPVTIARLYTALDDTDRAFDLLEKALNEHDGQLTDVTTDPLFDRLRSDQRYSELIRRMGLPE